jgi:shikimate dehydrogenase
MIESGPPLAGVIGYPIGHSRSPLLHGHWLKRYGIAGFYIPISLSQPAFEAGLRSLHPLGFKGVNVTIPHKVSAIGIADSVTDRAALIGAANTLTFRPDGSIRADNTDGYGFIQNIRQTWPDWDARVGPALVLGAGGAARAVVSALLSEGVPEIRLANRTRARSEVLQEHFGARVHTIDWNRASDATEGAAVIVNTTSLGMQGQPDLKLGLTAAPDHAVVADLVYTPLDTPLLANARARGLRVVDGLGMLLHQAAPGFEAWFGRRPEVDDDLRRAVLGG